MLQVEDRDQLGPTPAAIQLVLRAVFDVNEKTEDSAILVSR